MLRQQHGIETRPRIRGAGRSAGAPEPVSCSVAVAHPLSPRQLHADVADAKKKSKKTKKTKAEVKSTANLAVETRLAEIAGLQYVVDQ